jgi:pimeloyl-ACP methyl ester carboxylesterase
MTELPLSPSLRQWRALGVFHRFAAHRIFLREAGDVTRPALLLLHGFPTASFDWQPIWGALGEQFHLFAPDLLGFGFSSKPRAHRYSVLGQADMVESLLEEREIARVHILAHDLGDSVAQELLARHEHRQFLGESGLRIDSICFLNGGLFPEAHRPRLIQRLLASPLGPLLAPLLDRKRFARSFSAVFGAGTQPSPELLDDCWALIANDDGQRLAPQLLGYIAERRRRRAEWVGAMQATRVPLRLVAGLDDPVSGAHLVARYRELLSVPDVVEMTGIGHYPQIEAPAKVIEACRSFWTRIGAQQVGR